MRRAEHKGDERRSLTQAMTKARRIDPVPWGISISIIAIISEGIFLPHEDVDGATGAYVRARNLRRHLFLCVRRSKAQSTSFGYFAAIIFGPVK